MSNHRNRLKFNPLGGGEAEGRFAITALVVAVTIRWTAVILVAGTISVPIKMFLP
jgi:hypothetical protein